LGHNIKEIRSCYIDKQSGWDSFQPRHPDRFGVYPAS